MRLSDIAQKINYFLQNIVDLRKDLFIILLVLVVAIGAFISGRLSVLENMDRGGVAIIDSATSLVEGRGQVASIGAITPSATSSIAEVPTPLVANVQGAYVGSKSGKVYHLPWCSGAKRIKDENKVWFGSKEDAEAKGYKPAGNCKGI